MTRNGSSTLVANGEVSIAAPTRRRTAKPAMSPGELRREIKRAETVNAIVRDAGMKPTAYIETFKVEGGGE